VDGYSCCVRRGCGRIAKINGVIGRGRWSRYEVILIKMMCEERDGGGAGLIVKGKCVRRGCGQSRYNAM